MHLISSLCFARWIPTGDKLLRTICTTGFPIKKLCSSNYCWTGETIWPCIWMWNRRFVANDSDGFCLKLLIRFCNLQSRRLRMLHCRRIEDEWCRRIEGFRCLMVPWATTYVSSTQSWVYVLLFLEILVSIANGIEFRLEMTNWWVMMVVGSIADVACLGRLMVVQR